MSYDPAWDMPQVNWKQQGSYEQGSIPPVIEPDAGTQVWLGPLAREWLPWICGAADQLRNPSAWIVADDNAMFNTLRRVDTLLGLLCGNGGSSNPIMIRFDNCTLQTSTDGGVSWIPVPGWDERFCPCVTECAIPPPPLLPPGSPPATRACNIASYLANDVIHVAITQAINAYDHDLSLLALAGNIAAATFAFDLPWTAAFIYGLYDLYAFFTAGNIASLRAAEADAALWSDVTCAIYLAIKADGAITRANCSAVIAAICALTYTPAVAISAICAYVTQLGCDGLLAAQVPGALAVGDCSGCEAAGFCQLFDFTTGTHGWGVDHPSWGTQVNGVGWESVYDTIDNLSIINIDITGFPATLFNFWRARITLPGTEDPSYVRDVQFWLGGSLIHTDNLNSTPYPPHSIITNASGFSGTFDMVRFRIYDTGNVADVVESFELGGPGANPFLPAIPCNY